MKKTSYILLVLLFLITIQANTWAQCCAAGNPASNDFEFLATQKGILRAAYTLRTSLASAYYQKDSKIDEVFLVDHSKFLFSELAIAYGIFKKIEIGGTLGYYHKKTEYYNLAGFDALNAKGFGDLSLHARTVLYASAAQRIRISAMLGVSLPIGEFDLVQEGVKLPIQLQPSAGATKLLSNLYLSKELPSLGLFLFGQLQGEFSNRIKSLNFDYKYGNFYSASIGSAYKVNRICNLGLMLRGEMREMALREANQIVETTGSKVIYLAPRVGLYIYKNWALALLPMLPVYRYYNGIQLANTASLSIQLSNSFKIN